MEKMNLYQKEEKIMFYQGKLQIQGLIQKIIIKILL